jgi:hypothetical protein
MSRGRSCLLAGLLEGVGEPFEALVETISRGGTGGLDVLNGVLVAGHILNLSVTYPSTLSQAVEAELISNLGGVHGILYKIST